MSNIISTLGSGSGINTQQLIEDLVEAERAPTDALLDGREQKYEAQISGYGALRSLMTGVQDSVTLLADTDSFNARSVSFPDTALVSPTEVEPGALAGDYTIEVVALASAQSLSASGFAELDTVVGNGELTFTFGDWAADHLSFTANADKTAQSITIDDSNNTLTGIRDAINAADFGVQASIVENNGSYILQVTSASGASNELQISVVEGTPTGLSALSYEGFPPAGGMTENVSGEDASLKVNGLLVTRDSNQIDDVIDGLSFSLNQVSVANETVNISISEDHQFGEQIIRDFVDSYNLFLESVADLTKLTDSEDEEDISLGSLSSDPTAKGMIRQIRSLISQTITGIDGNFSALATVGIETNLDGTIGINEDLFQQALDDNYKELAELFTGTSSSTDTGVSVVKTSGTTAAGSYEVIITTQPEKGGVVGAAITGGDAGILKLTTSTGVFFLSLDTSLADYSFQVTVDGSTTDLITLTGTYADVDELIADMQAQINGDANLKGVGAALDISYDTTSGSFSATSREYGSVSQVSFSSLGVDMSRFGLGTGTESAGVDVVGTIDGVSAFGSGNILLPEFGSELAGLSLEISPTATSATVTIARGFSNELNNILDAFLENNGLIASREDSINDRLEDIEEDRSRLDIRMETRAALLQAQFLAMERIIASLNTTSSSLDGLIDRLPFTASNS
jgi:flagellar hook-associated protein 2